MVIILLNLWIGFQKKLGIVDEIKARTIWITEQGENMHIVYYVWILL